MLTVLCIGMVLMSGCTGTAPAGTATPTPSAAGVTVLTPAPTVTTAVPVTPTPAPAPAPEPPSTPAPAPRDPIIGSWQNGMVFYANGTVGSDGFTTWRANGNENYSYFVISDAPSRGAANQRNVTSTEWRYNRFSDAIYLRGSTDAFARTTPAATPAVTPPAPALPATTVSVTTAALTTVTTPVPATTALTTRAAPVTTKTAVPTTRVTTRTAPPATRTPVPTALPTTRAPVLTLTALPFASGEETGLLVIHTGGLGNDVFVYIVREGTDAAPFETVIDSSGRVIESRTSGYIPVRILPDGSAETISLAVGNYIAYLPDRSGGPPEQQSFTINAHCTSDISFLGYTYRASSGGGCGG